MLSATPAVLPPPDQKEREHALDVSQCVLVRAPAGSGKTDLLTRRFLRLLSEVDEPEQIAAITFTRAAAAEMRHRILENLEKAAASGATAAADDKFSMDALAQRALAQSQKCGWNLTDLPARLRISTIDSFCRELAIQQPLLSGLGGGLEIDEQPRELYRRAARRTLEAIHGGDQSLREAIETLLFWRDNGWQEIESQLVEMLETRDRWMHEFVVTRNPDWNALRKRLERPFRNCVSDALTELNRLLDRVPGAREEALELARFACAQSAGDLHQELAELAGFPAPPFEDAEELETARQACLCLAALLQTKDGAFRKRIDKSLGFPSDQKREKDRLTALIASLDSVPGLESALAALRELPPARYTEEDWRIVQACFLLLRRAAAELKVVFAETGTADYIEVAQIAEDVLQGENEIPGETALAMADNIKHLLVDEFQDTSRRQHRLLGRLIAAWVEREGRTCFVVGDPMQSIYFFRDADAELFPRVENTGLEIPHDRPLLFHSIRLFANFRTARPLVTQFNEVFSKVFKENDGSGVTFSSAEPARGEDAPSELQIVGEKKARIRVHVEFMPEVRAGASGDPGAAQEKEKITGKREEAGKKQTAEIVDVIRRHLPAMEQARTKGAKYRIAVLGRTRKTLAPVAEALRVAAIPFRAVELEELRSRPEIQDALALARALLSPQDRVAWLGVLRAPWCGLSLEDLHTLVSADDPELQKRAVPDVLAERKALLSAEGRAAVERVLHAITAAQRLRFAEPASSPGTWIEQVWLLLGGAQCVDAAGRANVELLWRALGALPDGEQDLCGPALEAALEKLTALPDPAADPHCGVQLMTIHKSKGLEFEVVIVPDLQACPARGKPKLLSWLERGLERDIEQDIEQDIDRGIDEPDHSDQATEFLVAPLQSKGSDRGSAKAWVDRVYRERERQEMRRLLYVAATRAREELHLFARPAYKTERDGSLSLVEPRESLLATAWPAIENEIRTRFEAWSAGLSEPASEPAIVESIAASGENAPLAISSLERGTLLRRLPLDFQAEQVLSVAANVEARIVDAGQLYERHEGGVLARALGTAVHTLLEELARLRTSLDWSEACAALTRMEPRLNALARARGIERPQASHIVKKALEIVLQASGDPIGRWILSPHVDAASEVRWTGVAAGTIYTVQVDRVFRSGAAPLSMSDDVWWVIDYKTAHEEDEDPAVMLPRLRSIFAPQIELYAQVLRNLRGAEVKVNGGLYYPRMAQFDWWEI